MESRAEYLNNRSARASALIDRTARWWIPVVWLGVAVGAFASRQVSPWLEFAITVALAGALVARTLWVRRALRQFVALFEQNPEREWDSSGVGQLRTYMLDPHDAATASALDHLLSPRGGEAAPLTGSSPRHLLGSWILVVPLIAITVLNISGSLSAVDFRAGVAVVYLLFAGAMLELSVSSGWSNGRMRLNFDRAPRELFRLWLLDPGVSGRVISADDGYYTIHVPYVYRASPPERSLAVLSYILVGVGLLLATLNVISQTV
jgi:hypothetical protein